MRLDEAQTTLGRLAGLGRDYFGLPLPSEVDGHFAAVVAAFVDSDERFRTSLGQSLTRVQSELLMAFAIRMASLAVREDAATRLRVGLLATALASRVPDPDWRDFALQLPPIEDAASRLGESTRSAFAEAARLAPQWMAGMLLWAAPLPSGLLRGLKRIKLHLPGATWKVIQEAAGPRYVPVRTYTEDGILWDVARGQMQALREALEAYRHDNGHYPSTVQGLAALWETPTEDPRPANWKGPYLRRAIPLDPWGRPYRYICPAEALAPGFELHSDGPDPQAGGKENGPS